MRIHRVLQPDQLHLPRPGQLAAAASVRGHRLRGQHRGRPAAGGSAGYERGGRRHRHHRGAGGERDSLAFDHPPAEAALLLLHAGHPPGQGSGRVRARGRAACATGTLDQHYLLGHLRLHQPAGTGRLQRLRHRAEDPVLRDAGAILHHAVHGVLRGAERGREQGGARARACSTAWAWARPSAW